MSPVDRLVGPLSGSMSGQSGATTPPADIHQSSISTSDPNPRPFDPSPLPPSQEVSVPSFPTNSSSEPRPSRRVARPGRRYACSRSSLDENRLPYATLTTPTSSDTSPSSQPAGLTPQSAPSSLGSTPSHPPRPRTVRPRSDNHNHRSNSRSLPPLSRSSRQFYSGDTLVDESELFPSLGSAVLLRGSTISDRLIQLSYEANRYELLQQYRLAPQALSQSISIYGAHPSIPITQWPELDEGILYFIDFTDARVKNALPYFRPSVSALTAYFATNSLVGPYDRASLWMPIRPEASGRQDYARNTRRDADGVIEAQPEPSDPWAPGSGPQRQRQAMGQFPEAYARMAGNGQASGARLESYMGVRRSGSARVMRLSGSETGRASRILPQEHWIAQNSQIMPTASRSSLRNPTRPVAWPGEWHRPVDRLLTLPIAGTAGLQQPSDTGRWHGSPPRPTYPPSAIFTPTMAQPDMGGPPNYRHSSRNVPRGATALTIGRVDFGHGPDFPAPRPVSGQVNRAAQRRARSGSPRGRGAARGRGTEYRRYH